MNTNKILMGGIAGGVALFLLGWVFYGMLLMDFMANNAGTATGVMKAQNEMQMWGLVLGNLAYGFLLAIIFGRWATSRSGWYSGARAGFVIGLLTGISIDFSMYATTNIYNMNAVLADIVAWTLMSAIAGAVVAWVMGMGKAEPATA